MIPLESWLLAGLIVWVPASVGLLWNSRQRFLEMRRRYYLEARIAIERSGGDPSVVDEWEARK